MASQTMFSLVNTTKALDAITKKDTDDYHSNGGTSRFLIHSCHSQLIVIALRNYMPLKC